MQHKLINAISEGIINALSINDQDASINYIHTQANNEFKCLGDTYICNPDEEQQIRKFIDELFDREIKYEDEYTEYTKFDDRITHKPYTGELQKSFKKYPINLGGISGSLDGKIYYDIIAEHIGSYPEAPNYIEICYDGDFKVNYYEIFFQHPLTEQWTEIYLNKEDYTNN